MRATGNLPAFSRKVKHIRLKKNEHQYLRLYPKTPPLLLLHHLQICALPLPSILQEGKIKYWGLSNESTYGERHVTPLK